MSQTVGRMSIPKPLESEQHRKIERICTSEQKKARDLGRSFYFGIDKRMDLKNLQRMHLVTMGELHSFKCGHSRPLAGWDQLQDGI